MLSQLVWTTVFVLFLASRCVAEDEGGCGVDGGPCQCGTANSERLNYYTLMNNPSMAHRVKRSTVSKKAGDGDWPWVVFIDHAEFTCTGSIIGDKWILTAGHCLDEVKNASDLLVRYGGENMREDGDMQIAFVRSFVVHEEYEAESEQLINNDIGLIELAEPLVQSKDFHEICLPGEIEPKEHEIAVFAGFGERFIRIYDIERTKQDMILNSEEFRAQPADGLRETPITLLTNTECHEILNATDAQLDTVACTGKTGHGTTAGDSGGPLMLIRNGKWVQYGISSTGWFMPVYEDLLAVSNYGSYTKVAPYCDWIKTKTDNQVSCSST